MIALIAAIIMIGFFAGTYAVAFVAGDWCGKRGGVRVVARRGFRQARVLDEHRRRATGGKHRDAQLTTLAEMRSRS